jgi:UDP-3-O-[3-hydroxymyristoyl] glucosamine N-acyltransferase
MQDYYADRECQVYQGANIKWQKNIAVGNAGLSHVRNENGEWEDFPHVGDVIIGNNVLVGDGCCIDRGTLGPTFIGNGTKIAKMVHIGHNCIVGSHVFLGGHTNLGGGSVIGNWCFIGMGVIVRNSVHVGDKTLIGQGSNVVSDIPDGVVAWGNPCKVRYKHDGSYAERGVRIR